VFGTPGDFCLYTKPGKIFFQLFDSSSNERFPVSTLAVQFAGDVYILLVAQIAQTKVFQLPFYLPYSQAIGERCIDILSLCCHQPLDLGRLPFQTAHFVQAFRQYNQYHADIIRNAQQHSAQIFGVFGLGFRLFLVTEQRQRSEPGHITHHTPNPWTETALYSFLIDLLALEEIVQKHGNQCLSIQPQAEKNISNRNCPLQRGFPLRFPAIIVLHTQAEIAGHFQLLDLLRRALSGNCLQPGLYAGFVDRLIV